MTDVHRLPGSVRSERLDLRCWQPGDGAVLAEAVGQSLDHLRPWMPWIELEPQSAAEREEWIAGCRREWESGGSVVFGVFRLDSGQVIGGSGLHRRSTPDALEIGYWLHPAHTARGFATELTAALTAAAFAQPGIERVVVRHDLANVRSAAVPRRLGFTMVGEVSVAVAAPGERGVEVTWAVTAAEWDTGAGRRRGTMGTWPSSSSSTDPT